MARKKKESNSKPIEQYEHKDKQRLNNPPVGLVDSRTDNGGLKKKTYEYDPHIDPQLQWAGKAEHTSFEVPTVSLHVHERIDPRRIIESVKKDDDTPIQISLFETQKKPLREAIEFYRHKENWTNRLIAGDSLLVMNSLLEKEGMGGKVQMIYFDPPYGIKYGSNFQPFINKRDVKDGKDEDLTAEPEMIKAFRDTWELGIHSYLTYLRDRLLLARELLHESGSLFVQISDENVHHVREILSEVFHEENFISEIIFTKTRSLVSSDFLTTINDFILWYGKDREAVKSKMRKLYELKTSNELASHYEDENGNIYSRGEAKDIADVQPEIKLRAFMSDNLIRKSNPVFKVEFKGKTYEGGYRTSPEGMKRLIEKNRIFATSNSLRYKFFLDDFPASPLNSLWTDTIGARKPIYVVQTNDKIVQRCLLMCTDPGELVLDITCGSGTTAYVAENWGRRWITCDTSRIAVALAKQRLMTASFDYYELAHPNEGVGSGFKYKTVPHITLKSLANDDPPSQETLYDQPYIDSKRLRVTGPFTVEAVPAPMAKSFEEVYIVPQTPTYQDGEGVVADTSVARSGETLRQSEWRDELLRAGVRAKGGKIIEFTRVEPLSGTLYLQAEAETREDKPKKVVVCFGPEHAPLEQRMVELALEEAGHLKPKPNMVLFCAFQFDEEAAKDIDETNWPGVTLLKAQMNADLLTEDLKKKRSSNESFWLIGQPDVIFRPFTPSETGKDAAPKSKNGKQYVVEVLGFDYYNPKTGIVESGNKGDIAMWMLDTDYDGRSLLPSQVFFPMAGAKEGWSTLAKNLKAQVDEDKIQTFGGTVSLPFVPGKAVAVKIIDARGIESLKIIR